MELEAAPADHAGHGHGGMEQHEPGPHLHEHGDHAHVHDPVRDAVVFWALMVGLALMQLGLKYWKSTRPRQFGGVSLLGLWLFPFGSSLLSGSWRFATLWAAFSLAVGWHLHLARQKPLRVTTPRRVYLFFDRLYRGASGLAIGCYVVIMVLIFMPPLQPLVPRAVMDALVAGCLLGLYFCVVTRDVTEFAAESITSSLGYTKKHDDDEVQRQVPRGLCALCGEDLRAAGEEEEGLGGSSGEPLAGGVPARGPPRRRGGAAGPGAAADGGGAARETGRLRGKDGETLYRLSCAHTFHEHCIKGWCVVGKKGMCPCCLERVDMRSILGATLWASPARAFTSFMDAVRYFVVWLPLLFAGVRLLVWALGLKMDSIVALPLRGALGGGNATGGGSRMLASAGPAGSSSGGGGALGAAAGAAAAALATPLAAMASGLATAVSAAPLQPSPVELAPPPAPAAAAGLGDPAAPPPPGGGEAPPAAAGGRDDGLAPAAESEAHQAPLAAPPGDAPALEAAGAADAPAGATGAS